MGFPVKTGNPIEIEVCNDYSQVARYTLAKVVVDLGKGERVAGCTFVATSLQVSTRYCILVLKYIFFGTGQLENK